jgi:hypothetical protein
MSREQHLLKLGAISLILSSVCVFVARIAHGDLPTDTGEDALRYVAAYPLYPLVHLGDWLGVLVWTGGLVALGGSFRRPAASALGLLGAVSVLVGAAVHIAEFSIDGYALPTLAASWAAAEPAARPQLEAGARLVLVALGGPSTSALVILWGTTLPLYGLAARAEGYPGWLGWTGLLVGAAIFLLGVIQFLKPNEIFSGTIFYGGGTVVSQVWTLLLGIAMWRRVAAELSRQPSFDRTP